MSIQAERACGKPVALITNVHLAVQQMGCKAVLVHARTGCICKLVEVPSILDCACPLCDLWCSPETLAKVTVLVARVPDLQRQAVVKPASTKAWLFRKA